MKKSISLLILTMISVLLVACEPPAVTDISQSIPAITLSNATLNLNVGETKPLGVTVRGFAASELRYVSQDPTIASVNAAGNVTAVAPGAVLVTASYQDLSESVYVFVLPSDQPVVSDVQLNDDNEIIIIYSDGTIENTGVKGANSASAATIRSAVVNAAGNLIITLSDGTTYNAGRVVGPAGSGGSGPAGPQGIQGPAGSIGTVTKSALLSALDLTESDFNSLLELLTLSGLLSRLEISSGKWATLQTLDLSSQGFQTLLTLDEEGFAALLDTTGQVSYNRYRDRYPGYTLPEDVWFKELNDGTLRIDVHFDFRTTLGEIYFPVNSEVSGVYGTDYLFVGTKFGSFDANRDGFITGATVYVGDKSISSNLSSSTVNVFDMEVRLLYFGSGLVTDYPNILVNNGTVSTLKGALITASTNPNYTNAVTAFRNNPINTYFDQLRFKSFVASGLSAAINSGIVDASGLFIIDSGLVLRATYEPLRQSRISSGAPDSYTTSLSSLIDFFINLNVGQAGLTSNYPVSGIALNSNSGLFVNGDVYDWYGNEFTDGNSYYRNYFVPMYEILNRQFNQSGRLNDSGFVALEGHYNYPSDKNTNGELIPTNYLGTTDSPIWPTYNQNASSWIFTGNIAGNDLRKWDIFYTVLDSGFTLRSSGILTSSGYAWASTGSNTSATNSGFIQLTAPIRYNAQTGNGQFVRFSDDNEGTCGNNQCQFGHLGVTLSGITMNDDDARFDTTDTHTIATVASVTGLQNGDIVFVRSEVNFTTGEPQEQRWMFVQDNTVPLIDPLFVGVKRAINSPQYHLPFIAKADDQIWISVAASEPVTFSYSDSTNITFFSSGVALISGIAEVGLNRATGLNGSFTTITSDHIRVRVNQNDEEGYFVFSGLKLIDRAGNVSAPIASSGFANQVWIDPKAPTVETSGFTGINDATNSGTVTASGVLNSIPFYHVSGMIDYNFDFAETLNDITSGLVKYRLELKQSGLLPYNSGVGTHDLVGGLNSLVVVSGLGQYTLSGLIKTNDYQNGLYVLTLFLEDLVGNKSEFKYFLYIENELFISEATVVEVTSGQIYDVTITFNTFYTLSGLVNFDANDITVNFVNSSGNVLVNSPGQFTNIVFTNLSRTLTFRVTVSVADYALMESIEISIKASGTPKFKEDRLNLPLNNDSGVAAITINGPAAS